jgi:RES domain-containing protein
MFLWRISNHPTLDGGGGLETSGRWHTQGRPIVYLAESAAGALLEVLVHLELSPVRLPRSYRLLKIEAPDELSMRELSENDLSRSWTRDETETRTTGDEWLASKRTLLLRVPSAVAPETFNVLLNSAHEDTRRLRIVSHREYPWDPRLISKPSSARLR